MGKNGHGLKPFRVGVCSNDPVGRTCMHDNPAKGSHCLLSSIRTVTVGSGI
ncbi:hypothetical protein SS05631_c22960 [Sinorhizobium sp. CCBAU 05631]|nr:hypothetical protein SS05631_c22960 [Sinorhizobium sp. CCBAU 05631]